jgi:hypothetical protein
VNAVVVTFNRPRRKVKQFTRRQLHRTAQAERKAEKQAARADAKRSLSRARREQRVLSVFQGVDPERTLALLGEEY